MTKPTYRCVHIKWLDSHTNLERVWQSIKDQHLDMPPLDTVGFLVKEDKNWVCIASSVDSDGDRAHCSGVMRIPRRTIISTKTIKLR